MVFLSNLQHPYVIETVKFPGLNECRQEEEKGKTGE